uniref:G-protein coupled receptors family 1 profile domain-containing protein n=1 Tax=Eptatretus burgeri TaxID=7764 RepID=A0A8C4PWA7_EPTBU
MLLLDVSAGGSPTTATILALLCLGGIVGNTAHVVLNLCYSDLKTVTAIFLFNQAVLDSIGAFTDVLRAVAVATTGWPFGSLLCKLQLSIRYLIMLARVYILSILSLDRYLVSHHRACSRGIRTSGLAWALSILIWMLSFVLTTPVLLMATTRGSGPGYVCTLSPPRPAWWWRDVWSWSTFGAAYLIPLLSITACHVVSACKHFMRRGCQRSGHPSSLCRATKFVLSAVVVYVLCWTPAFALTFAQLMGMAQQHSAWGSRLAVLAASANGCVNPLLYAQYDRRFGHEAARAVHACGAPWRVWRARSGL